MAHQLNNVENKCLLCLPSKTLMMIIIMTLSSKSLWLYLAIFILQSSSTIVNGYLFSTNSGQSLSLSSSSSSSSRSSVHRFSNLYGTIIHCQDYLQPITTTKSSSSSSTLTTNSINHHMSHLLPRPSSSTAKSSLLMIENGLEHDLQSMLDLAYQQYSNNISFEWQVGFQQQSSQQSSSSSLQYQKAIDLAQLRSTNPKDGTLALSPFGLDSFIPDVHDAYYRCLLHMPNGYGIITSRELHLQAGRS